MQSTINVKEKLSEGYIYARVIIEVLGKPKNHVEETIRGYVQKIKDEEAVYVVTEIFEEAIEKDKLWSTFVELEILAKTIQDLIGFCFDYMPASLEILQPIEFRLKDVEISNFLNDLQQKLHDIDMKVKYLKTENGFIKQNMARLLQNSIAILLSSSERDLNNLTSLTGIDIKELETFLEQLEQKNIIIKKEGKYSLIQSQ